MKKALTKYLLSLCIIWLSGYDLLSAHILHESAFFSLIKVPNGSDYASFESVRHNQPSINAASTSPVEKGFKKIEAAEKEVEEDDLSYSRKHLQSSDYITSIFFYALIFGYLVHHIKIKRSFLFREFSSYFSSFRSLHIIFRVFRI